MSAPTIALPKIEPRRDSRTWPAWGVAAGVLGVVGTLFTDAHPRSYSMEDTYSSAVINDVPLELLQPGLVAGYLAVAALLFFAATWRVHVSAAHLRSVGAAVVPLSLTASAAGLALGYGWKGALGLYGPGGPEEGAFDQAGLYVYFVLNDFGTFIPWLGVIVAAAGVAWAGLHEKVVARWLGIVSAVPPVLVLIAVAVTGVPGLPALLAPLWLVVLSVGLMLSKHGR